MCFVLCQPSWLCSATSWLCYYYYYSWRAHGTWIVAQCRMLSMHAAEVLPLSMTIKGTLSSPSPQPDLKAAASQGATCKVASGVEGVALSAPTRTPVCLVCVYTRVARVRARIACRNMDAVASAVFPWCACCVWDSPVLDVGSRPSACSSMALVPVSGPRVISSVLRGVRLRSVRLRMPRCQLATQFYGSFDGMSGLHGMP